VHDFEQAAFQHYKNLWWMLLQSPTFHCKASPVYQGKWHDKYKKSVEETIQFLAIMEVKLKISVGLDKKRSRL